MVYDFGIFFIFTLVVKEVFQSSRKEFEILMDFNSVSIPQTAIQEVPGSIPGHTLDIFLKKK